MSMDISPALQSLEASLKTAGVPIDDFCGSVGIHRATWQRWKAGKTSPTLREVQAMIAKAGEHKINLAPDSFFEAAE